MRLISKSLTLILGLILVSEVFAGIDQEDDDVLWKKRTSHRTVKGSKSYHQPTSKYSKSDLISL